MSRSVGTVLFHGRHGGGHEDGEVVQGKDLSAPPRMMTITKREDFHYRVWAVSCYFLAPGLK